MLLREKDATFVQDTRIEGNLSVVTHPGNPSFYGDGSVEISGILRTDGIMSATPQSVVHLGSPLNLLVKTEKPQLPIPGQTQIYSDSEFNGRLVMVDSEGNVIDLNPLKNVGDIMTYDGVKNTTVRFGVGLPGQKLTLDPWINYSTGGLSWKSEVGNVHPVASSDQYVKYLELTNGQGTALTGTPVVVPFTEVLRCDGSAFSVGTNDFLILQAGVYEITISLTVGFPENLEESSIDSIGCVEMYVNHTDSNDPSGYSTASGSKTYSTFPTHGKERAWNTLTCKTFLNLSSNSRIRVYAREYGTNTGLLQVLPQLSTISTRKMIIGSPTADTSEYLSVHGLDGARPSVTTVLSPYPINTVIYRTNVNDSIVGNTVQLENGGIRNIFGKVTFAANNIPDDAFVVVESSLTINNVLVPGTTCTCQIIGNQSTSSSYINTMIDVADDDIVRLQGKILSSEDLTSGAINVVAEECVLYIEKLNAVSDISKVLKKAYLYNDSAIGVNSSKFSSIDLISEEVITDEDEFKIGDNGEITCKNGGSYQYLIQTTIENADTEPFTVLLKAMVDIADGYKDISGSESYTTVHPECMQDVVKSGVIFLPPNSRFKFQCLATAGGNVLLRDDSTKVLLSKIESTNVSFTGQSDFGRFFKYVADEQVVITTSTILSLRLAAVTVNIPEGRYRLGTSFEWDMTDAGVGFEGQIVLDDNTVLESYSTVPVLTGSYQKITSFREISLSDGEHSIAFKTRVFSSSRALHTRNVRIELWKI